MHVLVHTYTGMYGGIRINECMSQPTCLSAYIYVYVYEPETFRVSLTTLFSV